MKKIISICQNLKMWQHEASQQSVEACVAFCQEKGLDYQIIDPYANDAIEKMCASGVVVWFIQNYLYADLMQATHILRAVEDRGVKVFPSSHTNWHFDDKIAEMYAFQAVKAPIPQSWVFYHRDTVKDFLSTANYPLVAKLRSGSGASNVMLLKNESQAQNYAKRMFSKGYNPMPSLLYKAYSKAQSSYDFKTVIHRIKKIPMFLLTRKGSKLMPNERGYCYFQEFVENAGYDLKVVVIGDKLTFVARYVRKGDFRASGGGTLFYDHALMTPQIIQSAFQCADELKLQCMGFDYVVDKKSGKAVIVEMCYGFDFAALEGAGGYYDRQAIWHPEPMHIADEIMEGITKELSL